MSPSHSCYIYGKSHHMGGRETSHNGEDGLLGKLTTQLVLSTNHYSS